MEFLHNGFTLEYAKGAFPFSTDSMALSGFVRLPRQAQVLDLGSGCGTLGVLLCAKDGTCQVTGIELNETAHQAALGNIEANALASRLKSICADLRDISRLVPAQSFHCIVSNPPYFSAGPRSKEFSSARREDTCSLEELFSAARWALRYGGDFYLVYRPERFAEVCGCAERHGMQVKTVCLLRHKPQDPVSLVLIQCRKGAKPGLIWQEQVLFQEDGSPTDYYKALYHI